MRKKFAIYYKYNENYRHPFTSWTAPPIPDWQGWPVRMFPWMQKWQKWQAYKTEKQRAQALISLRQSHRDWCIFEPEERIAVQLAMQRKKDDSVSSAGRTSSTTATP